MRYETHTHLPPERVLDEAAQFFGDAGLKMKQSARQGLQISFYGAGLRLDHGVAAEQREKRLARGPGQQRARRRHACASATTCTRWRIRPPRRWSRPHRRTRPAITARHKGATQSKRGGPERDRSSGRGATV